MPKTIGKSLLALVISCLGLILTYTTIQAATPTAPSYELVFRPMTSGVGDNTGDGGGTGNPYTYQEYYVGQTFDVDIIMNTGGRRATSGDVIIEVDPVYLSCTPNYGTIMEAYADTYDATTHKFSITGYMTTSGKAYIGTNGRFATLRCNVLKKREPIYGTSLPLPLTFEYTVRGDTLDSNIGTDTYGTWVVNGDMLIEAENGLVYLWPDVNKPYVNSFNPALGTSNVNVNDPIRFMFHDSNTTSGDETGVNTGTMLAQYRPAGSATASVSGSVSWANCTGTWNNRNHCQGTFAPNTLIGGNRRYSYNTTYELCLSKGQDYASPLQDPGEEGPNVMDPTCTTFTTRPDVDPPTIINHSPTGNGVQVDRNISFTIRDIQAGTGIWGTGVDPNTAKVEIWGKKAGNIDFNVTVTCSDPGVTCTPLGTPLENGRYYAYDVVIDPSLFDGGENFDNFAQDVEINVRISEGEDYAGNTMAPFEWTFRTSDTTPPWVENIYPVANLSFCVTSASSSAEKLISFEVLDGGVGVPQENIIVRVGNDFYQIGASNSANLSFTGDSNHWYVTLDPLVPLASHNNPFPVMIYVEDASGNAIDPPIAYALVLNCDGTTTLDPDVCKLDNFCNPLCLNDPDCTGGTNCRGEVYCGPDATCNPWCLNDPDCTGGSNCRGDIYCGGDGTCNQWCLNDPDCPGGTNCVGGSCNCTGDGTCNPVCAYDPDCTGGGSCRGEVFCWNDNHCNAWCLNDPDCAGGGNCRGTSDCGDDDWCNEECVHDPDCPGGGNCRISNCDGKNYESCSSCCPSVDVPAYPDPRVVYRYREVCSTYDGEDEGDLDNTDVITTSTTAITATNPFTFNANQDLNTTDDSCTGDGSFCKNRWTWFPWLIIIILACSNLHQRYRKRQYKHKLRYLEKVFEEEFKDQEQKYEQEIADPKSK